MTKIVTVFSIILVLVMAMIGGCASGTEKTVTVTAPAVTLPGATVTLPGSTTTLPQVTVTLPGSTTTIPSTTVTVPPFTTTVPPETISSDRFLPSTPAVITSHPNLLTTLSGQCLTCHGEDGYNQFPTAPIWDGTLNLSAKHPYVYTVIPGSIQDHTGRTADMCLNCHTQGM